MSRCWSSPALVVAAVTAAALAGCGDAPGPTPSSTASPSVAQDAAVQTPAPVPSTPGAMSEDRFWSIVDSTASGGADQQVDAVRARLAKLSTDELVAYDKRLIDLSNGILTWRHLGAAEVIIGFTSDDVFTDFRTWVIFQGRKVYTAFRADPDSLAAHGPDDDEGLAVAEYLEFLASEVYQERTGEEIHDRPDYPVYVDIAGEQIDHSNAALARLYPKLAARYMRDVDPDGSPADGPRSVS